MTARASLAMVKEVEAGAAVSYGRTWIADRPTRRSGWSRSGTPTGCRASAATAPRSGRRRPAARCAAGSAWTSSSSTSAATTAEARAPRSCCSGRATHGEPTAQDWAEACGTISYEIVTRIGGRMTRRHVDSERTRADEPVRGRIVGVAAGAAGVAAAGAAVGIVRQRRAIGRAGRRRHRRSAACARRPITVSPTTASPLHVEVDELDAPAPNGRRGRRKAAPPLTVVFAHGYALNLDCWHFQRAAYRGLVRTVFYDQRSHGRSGRSSEDNATIDQLGRDLLAVLDAVVPRRARSCWSATRWAA